MYRFTRDLAFSAMLFVVATAYAATPSESADRGALESAAQAWVAGMNARDANALAGLVTQDVVLMEAGVHQGADAASVIGREAVRESLKRSLTGVKGRVTSTTRETTISGDVAWRIALLTRELPGGTTASRSPSLEIWKRVNGQWKLHRQMAAGALAGPPVFTRPSPSEPMLDKVPQ